MRQQRYALVIGSLLLALAACAKEPSTKSSAPSDTPPSRVNVSGAVGDSEAWPEGIVVDIGSDVAFVQSTVSVSSGPSTSKATINGHAYELAGDTILIGSKRYGPVAKGDRVRIDAAGVFVNGQLLGPLP